MTIEIDRQPGSVWRVHHAGFLLLVVAAQLPGLMALPTVPREWSKSQIERALDEIAQEKLQYELKEWQREGAANLLCGNDVLLLIETGAGKSLLFYLYALARPQEVVIVVSPLKLLEKNMVDHLKSCRIRATGLNADALAAVQREGRDLWKECACGDYQVIICSPERLASDEMDKLLAHKDFQAQVGLVVVDEVHLIPSWGKKFRRAFMGIGSLRSRLSSSTVLLALSATLMLGKPTEIVTRSLGLQGARFCHLKRNCTRRNVHLVLRRIDHPISSGTFKDLDWLIAHTPLAVESDMLSIPKTIVYFDSIAQGYRLVLYLRTLLPPFLQPLGNQIIRHIHASSCRQCKDEAFAEFSCSNPPSRLRIVVATDAFGCGIDIPDIKRVVNFGTPSDANSAYQRGGRSARRLETGEFYIYVNAHHWDRIKKQFEPVDRARLKRAKLTDNSVKSEDKITGCKYFRRLLEAHLKGQCVTRVAQQLYGDDVVERCQMCSGCIPDSPPSSEPTEPRGNTTATRQPRRHTKAMTKAPKASNRGPGRMTNEILTKAQSILSELMIELWLSIPADKSAWFEGPDALLSAEKQSLIVKQLRDVESESQIHELLGADWPHWDSLGKELAAGLLQVRETMIEDLRAKHAKRQERIQAEKNTQNQDEPELEDESDDDADSVDVPLATTREGAQSVVHQPERLIVRLPPRARVIQSSE